MGAFPILCSKPFPGSMAFAKLRGLEYIVSMEKSEKPKSNLE